MNALRLWGRTFWKEWRDHRGMLIALAITIPVLTAIACWAFGDLLSGQTMNTIALIFVPVPVGLTFFAIAADLVSGEHRHKTMGFLRRLPGGLVRSFVAKWCFVFLTTLALVLWQGLVLSFFLGLFHEVGTIRGGFGMQDALMAQLASVPTSMWWQLTLVGCVLAPWAFVVSTWLGRSGAAAIASVLVLGALVAPWVLLIRANPWFMPLGPSDLPTIALVLIGMATLVGAISYLGGLRWHGKPWRPALLGLGCVLLLGGGGYVHARASMQDWLDFGPLDEGFHIHDAYLAPDGKTVYMNVARGTAWWAGTTPHMGMGGPTSGSSDWGTKQGSPLQAWTVDLTSGDIERRSTDGYAAFGALRHDLRRVGWGYSVMAPYRTVVLSRFEPDPEKGRSSFTIGSQSFLDANTGETIATLPYGTSNRAVDRALIRELQTITPLRNAAGAPVWMRERRVEDASVLTELGEDGDVSVRALPRGTSAQLRYPLGWRVLVTERPIRRGGGTPVTSQHLLLATTGEKVPYRNPTGYEGLRSGFLAPNILYGRASNRTDAPWLLWSAETGDVLKRVEGGPRWHWLEIEPGLRLYPEKTPEAGSQLRIWNVRTGTSRAVVLDVGSLDVNLSNGTYARLPDGRLLVSCFEAISDEGGHNLRRRQRVFVLDRAGTEGTCVAEHVTHDWSFGTFLDYSDEDGLLVIEGKRRIVRYPAGEPKNRVVVWPRPGGGTDK